MLYIVTPVFNRINFTKQYLYALNNQTTRNFKIVIVDDGSTDGTSEMIKKNFPEVILLKEKGDLWWAEATNIGVKYSISNGANYVMTLNDDTLPKPDFIEKMLYWSSLNPDVLLGAAALSHSSSEIIFGGNNISWINRTIKPVLETLTIEERFGLHEVNFFPGRGLLIPVEVFHQIGYYDSNNFPQTVADLDFTHRAARAGFKIFCNYDAKIIIFENESANTYFKKNKSFKNFMMHLFSKKGGGNLFFFIKYAFKNCPRRHLFLFICRGLFGRIIGYWRA